MTKEEIIAYLKNNNSEFLFKEADTVRKKLCGDEIHIRGIIEFSNYCRRDCLYCGLRKSNKKLIRYRLSTNEILQAAQKAGKLKYKTIVLQSGEDECYRIKELCGLVAGIKRDVDCAVTLSIGEKTYNEYSLLKEAGADRYLLKFETSYEELYKKLKPDSSYKERLVCLKWLKELGYQVGSGNMVGLPGQTPEILAGDMLLMDNLDLDMIGIGPFVPHYNTPLQYAQRGTLEETLKMVALARIVTSNTHIPATTAVRTIDPSGCRRALQSGANVIMPNITPQEYKKYYEIYPGKVEIDDCFEECTKRVENIVSLLGRTLAKGYGHSLRQH